MIAVPEPLCGESKLAAGAFLPLLGVRRQSRGGHCVNLGFIEWPFVIYACSKENHDARHSQRL
jgi:hypothetical protein